MKKLSLLIASTMLSATALAADFDLPPLKDQAQMFVVGTVEIDGVSYQKLSHSQQVNDAQIATRSLKASQGLFAGDMVKKGKLSYVERVSGSFLISGKNSAELKQAAQAHGLTVKYTVSNKAVVLAPEDKELTAILNALKSDSRINVAKLERVSQRMQPE